MIFELTIDKIKYIFMNCRLIILMLLLIIPLDNSYGQEAEWEIEVIKDGSVTVTSRVYTIKDGEEKNQQIIEYNTTTQADLSLEQCLKLMRNVPGHKLFLQDTELSKVIKTISEHEWLIYYYFTSPWPLPDGDVVVHMKQIVTEEEKSFIFTGHAVPDKYPGKGVRRLTLNDISYKFRQISDEVVEITMASKFSPMINAPKWMVRAWFPNGPAEILKRLIEEAKKM